jgi:hypothetical protein
MKNFAKILFASVLSLGFGVAAQAQTGDNAVIAASATVLGNLEVEAGLPLAFGQVMPGFDKYVALRGNTVTSSSVGTVNATGVTSGFFKVFAAQGAGVLLGLTYVALNNGSEDLELDFNEGLAVGVDVTTVGWGTETIVPTKMLMDATTAISSFPASIIDTDKNGVFVYVGGTVRPTGTQSSGDYTGSITLTAAYN